MHDPEGKGQFPQAQMFGACHSQSPPPLPCEYAKYKNRLWLFHRGPRSLEEFRKMEVAMRDNPSQAERKPLRPAAQRALAEAEARREAAADAKPLPKEFQGPKGPERTRYGHWENKGIASDF